MQAYRSQVKHKLSLLNCQSTAHSLDPLFKGGGSKFWLPPPEGGIWKIEKRGWKYCAGAGLFKRGGWHCSYLMLSRFIIFTFTNYFTLYKIVMHLQVILIICIILLLLLFFPATIILWKKVILSCLKMNLKISHKLR